MTLVPEQSVVDGNFPTVESPNPEERKTMSKAIELAAREERRPGAGDRPRLGPHRRGAAQQSRANTCC